MHNILIIGASSGIGYATAKKLSQQYNIIAVARREERIKEFQNYEIFDATHLEETNSFLKYIVKKYDKLDGLIYCAGMQNIKPIKAISVEEAKEIFDVNYFAPLFFSKTFASKRICNANASITFISSIAGIKPERGIVNYSASKAALNALTLGLAKEIAPIRVNAIAPGFLDTEMTQKFDTIYTESFKTKIENEYPLGLGNVDDIANMTEFLISKKAKYITGEIIKVDGGALL